MIIEISWAEIERDTRILAEWLRNGPQIKGLIAIARGGLIPAALLARELDMRLVETIAVATYEGKEAGEPRLIKPAAVCDEGEGWVFVDDLVDRGHTAKFVRNLLPRARFVCLYAKPEGRPFADYVAAEFPQGSWLRFAWERPE